MAVSELVALQMEVSVWELPLQMEVSDSVALQRAVVVLEKQAPSKEVLVSEKAP